MEGKRKFDEKEPNNRRNKNQNKQQANKLTPQEQVNRKLLQKYLDTLSNPKKRVSLNYGTKKKSETQKLKVRCGLSFVDLSGLVDLRSLGIIVQALKPYNLILLPDYTPLQNLTRVQEFLPINKMSNCRSKQKFSSVVEVFISCIDKRWSFQCHVALFKW